MICTVLLIWTAIEVQKGGLRIRLYCTTPNCANIVAQFFKNKSTAGQADSSSISRQELQHYTVSPDKSHSTSWHLQKRATETHTISIEEPQHCTVAPDKSQSTAKHLQTRAIETHSTPNKSHSTEKYLQTRVTALHCTSREEP
jgi:hypothetical protein